MEDESSRLASPARLQALDLRHNYLTEAGTRALTRIGSLETLNVQYTEMASDIDKSEKRRPWPDGLADLAGLKNRRFVDITRSGASSRGVARLREAIPDLLAAP